MGLIDNFLTWITNKVQNAVGVERTFYELMAANDVDKAKQLFQNRDEEVLQAIAEYNPEQHKEVMGRGFKIIKGREPYIYEKLPRAWQRYINEVALFFLLAKPIIFRQIKQKKTDETNLTEAFEAFNQFLKDTRFNSTTREAKRIAGAETESAKWYHLYNDNGTVGVKVLVLAKSKGHTIRPLIDQYQNMLAFGYGYLLNENGKTIEHFDISTPDTNFFCRKLSLGWEVITEPNPVGKVTAMYYQQDKEWSGAERRIVRSEMVDSKQADTNNRLSEPKAILTGQLQPRKNSDGSIDQSNTHSDFDFLNVNDGGDFKYVSPPEASEERKTEREALIDSIHQDTLTPHFSPDQLKGLGTLSGDALKRAMIFGFIKRDIRMEYYDLMIDREKNLILAIMMKVTHKALANQLEKLKIEHEFAQPFDEDKNAEWMAIGKAYTDGIISLETAVELMGVASPEEEVNRILGALETENQQLNYPTGQPI